MIYKIFEIYLGQQGKFELFAPTWGSTSIFDTKIEALTALDKHSGEGKNYIIFEIYS